LRGLHVGQHRIDFLACAEIRQLARQFDAGVFAPGQQPDRLLAQFIGHGVCRAGCGNRCSTRWVSGRRYA